VHEVKFDGWRIQVHVFDGAVRILTRNGLDWTKKFPALAKQARGLDNCIIDGELCAIAADGLPDFAALQAAMKSDQTDDLVYFAFDAMFIRGEDLRQLSLLDRKARLRTLIEEDGNPPLIKFVTHLEVDGKDVIKAACEMKLEGIISKRISAPYLSGRKGRLDQGEMPRRPARGRWRLDHQRQGVQRPPPRHPRWQAPGADRARRHRLPGQAAALAETTPSRARDRCVALLGADPEEARSQAALHQAGARRRGPVHQLDRRSGPAPGVAQSRA
jgi:hypothetical protein